MQIICVSRGTLAGGRNLAENLASKLGYDCLSREEMTDAATRAGIPVGKLEMAIVNSRPLSEQMAVEKDRFKAFLTATLCERAMKNGLVYHGRTGHLVLPGIDQVLRVRVIQNREQRVIRVMERLGVSRSKALRYIEGVDEDRRRWIRSIYNIDWQDPDHYDVVVNLSHMREDNAASSLVAMAQLPEFQLTPAASSSINDLLTTSRCRLAIGSDRRTREMNVQVRAERGVVSVSYLPRQERPAAHIPDVLKSIEGVDEVICTMASTNLLWIQEQFDHESEALPQILEIASKWNAAVELARMSGTAEESLPQQTANAEDHAGQAEDHGGILDDTADEEGWQMDEGIKLTRDRLIAAGHFGGYRIVPASARALLNSLDRTRPYSLVVVGSVFLSKAASVRKRLSQEMVGYLSDSLRVPVIASDELKTRYLFGPAQWLRLLIMGAFSALVFSLVMTHQKELLVFLTGTGGHRRILGACIILIFVPIFAHSYGTFARYLLRLCRFE